MYIPTEREDNKSCVNTSCPLYTDGISYPCMAFPFEFLHNCKGYVPEQTATTPEQVVTNEQEVCNKCGYDESEGKLKHNYCPMCGADYDKQKQPEEWTPKIIKSFDPGCNAFGESINNNAEGIKQLFDIVQDLYERAIINGNRITENYMEHDDLSEITKRIEALEKKRGEE